MHRVVLDTNVLVGSAYNPDSASRRIVDACLGGEVVLLVSPSIKDGYERIVPRAVRKGDARKRLQEILASAELVHPESEPRIVPEDPEDDKFLAVALAGRADAVVTNDDHLLQFGQYEGIPILRPAEFVQRALR